MINFGASFEFWKIKIFVFLCDLFLKNKKTMSTTTSDNGVASITDKTQTNGTDSSKSIQPAQNTNANGTKTSF